MAGDGQMVASNGALLLEQQIEHVATKVKERKAIVAGITPRQQAKVPAGNVEKQCIVQPSACHHNIIPAYILLGTAPGLVDDCKGCHLR